MCGQGLVIGTIPALYSNFITPFASGHLSCRARTSGMLTGPPLCLRGAAMTTEDASEKSKVDIKLLS